jgi:hypothetical protein
MHKRDWHAAKARDLVRAAEHMARVPQGRSSYPTRFVIEDGRLVVKCTGGFPGRRFERELPGGKTVIVRLVAKVASGTWTTEVV